MKSGAPANSPPTGQAPFSLRKLYRWSVRSARGAVGPLVVVTILGIFTSLAGQYADQLITNFLSTAQGHNKTAATDGAFNLISVLLPNDAFWSAILWAIVSLILIGLGFANRVGTTWVNSRMLLSMQLRIHDKLLQMGSGYHAVHDMGENTALVMQYPPQAQPTMRDVLTFPFVRGIPILTAIIFLFYNLRDIEQPGVAYAVLAVLLVVLPIGGIWLSGKLRSAFGQLSASQAAVGNALVDSLTAPQEVQLMNAGAQRSSAFGSRLKVLAGAQINAAIQNGIAGQFQSAVPLVLQIGLILWAIFFGGPAALAAVAGIYFFVPRVVQPIQDLVNFYTSMNIGWPNIERVGLLLDEPPEIADNGKRSAADLKSFEVALNDVTFRPDPERTILGGITKTFAPGKITALVGRSGSGKTTIMRLIVRLFDPTSGTVTIGGTDVRDFSLAELRTLSATVSQFPLYVEASVRENLRLGRADATDAEMEAACRAADVWSALSTISQHDPLAAPVPRLAGKAGLAGGERRRLAIARTLLSDARILLLDEPSTGIDAMSITKILQQFRGRPDRTILIVDHDMDLIKAVADEICCIENGQFTAIGTPDELLSRPSLFKTLWDARRAYAGTGDLEVTGTVPVRPADVEPPTAPSTRPGGPPKMAGAGKPKIAVATAP